ncbi:MAG: capsid assembly protein [Desulfovibrio sp.]
MLQRTNNGGKVDWRTQVDVQVPVTDSEGQEMLIPVTEHPALKKYATLNDLVVGFINAQKLIGRKQVAEENKYGVRPERPEQYRLTIPSLPEGYDPSEGLLPQFLQVAHEAGLTDQQVQVLVNYLAELDCTCREHMQLSVAEQAQQAMRRLQQEWGEDFRKKMELGERFLMSIADDHEMEYLHSQGALDDPYVVRLLAKAGEALAEDFMRGGDNAPRDGQPNRSQLEKMLMDPRYADPDQRDSAFVRRVEDGFKALCKK